MVVSRAQPLAQIIGAGSRLVLCRCARRDTTRQHFHPGIGVRIEKERDRITVFHWDRNPVRRGDVNIVGPPHQAIANVANERSRNVRSIEPRTTSRAYLQSRNPIRGQNRKVAIVGMHPGAGVMTGIIFCTRGG